MPQPQGQDLEGGISPTSNDTRSAARQEREDRFDEPDPILLTCCNRFLATNTPHPFKNNLPAPLAEGSASNSAN
jgi:hypothetical protein